MKKIIPLIIILLVFSCIKEEVTETELLDENQHDLSLDNDIIYDEDSFKEDLNPSNVTARSSRDFVDTDGDGIADYAESNIENLDPYEYNDLLLMDPGTLLIITTVDGSIKRVPLYKTSFYQENMFDIHITQFSDRDGVWTEKQKELVTESFIKIKKVIRTPKFQKFIKDNFKATLAADALHRFRTKKNDVEFRHSRRWLGVSNLRSWIGLARWVMNDRHANHLLHETIAHELMHHMGYGHNGIPYGTEGIARNMAKNGEGDYAIFDINKKSYYINPCVPFAAHDNNNNHSIYHLKVPNTSINISGNGKGNYEVSSDPVTFNRGERYESIIYKSYIQFLFGGRYSMWIDYNDDAQFDANERLLYNVDIRGMGFVTHGFYIPGDANKGVHRMRIVKSTYNEAEACGFGYGQSIDFTNVTVQ
tara:strand:- start:609 stop:1868 length:1260 start_codon:yes stop_codon:yes gene_type:complete